MESKTTPRYIATPMRWWRTPVAPPVTLRARYPPPSPPDRAQCHDLAAGMVDLIEEDTIDSIRFAQARDRFAAICTPR
jgi:hypothetical protein